MQRQQLLDDVRRRRKENPLLLLQTRKGLQGFGDSGLFPAKRRRTKWNWCSHQEEEKEEGSQTQFVA